MPFLTRWPLAVLLAAAAASTGAWQRPGDGAPQLVAVQLLAFNDFHGHLEPPVGSNGRIGDTPAGGVEYLATHLARLRARVPNTLVVAAGDNVGASPLLSGLFHDEPAIEALNAAGLDVSSVGNHEFDEGWIELLRMQRGGCHPVDGCHDQTPFAGAKFQYLGANIRFDARKADPAALRAAGLDAGAAPPALLPPYAVKEIGGVKIGFIGLTLEGTRDMVVPAGIRPLTFEPEPATANRLLRVLDRQGVRSIVVLIHQGGAQGGGPEEVDGCRGFSGPIVDIAKQLSSAIGVIISGHTHRAYNCTIDGKLVTSAASFGRVITDIELQIDRATGRIASKTAHNLIVTRDVPKDPAETAILEHYRPFYADLAHRVIGRITGSIVRQPNGSGESALGDLIADAQLQAGKRLAGPDVAVAFMNSGGIRADLVAKTVTGPSDVTYEDAYTVQPFGNQLIVKTLTGRMIRRLLEQQFAGVPANGVLQVSAGFTYRYDFRRLPGDRVDAATIAIGGRPVQPAARYRVVMNEFLASGGDGFTVFSEGADAVNCGGDLDALAAFLAANSPVGPGPMNRIVKVAAGAPSR